MNRKEYLLTLVMEECAEVAQRASKAMRFGLNEVQPGTEEETNANRLIYEFNDLMAVMELLREEGHIDKVIDSKAIQLKKEKLEKWFKYADECGTITHESEKPEDFRVL